MKFVNAPIRVGPTFYRRARSNHADLDEFSWANDCSVALSETKLADWLPLLNTLMISGNSICNTVSNKRKSKQLFDTALHTRWLSSETTALKNGPLKPCLIGNPRKDLK